LPKHAIQGLGTSLALWKSPPQKKCKSKRELSRCSFFPRQKGTYALVTNAYTCFHGEPKIYSLILAIFLG